MLAVITAEEHLETAIRISPQL